LRDKKANSSPAAACASARICAVKKAINRYPPLDRSLEDSPNGPRWAYR